MIIETGQANALRFVKKVLSEAHEGRVVVIYAGQKYAPWPWMRNPAWQNFVLEELDKINEVRSGEFHPADNLDGLCFSCISMIGENKIDRLPLNHTIEGKIPPTGRIAKLRWIFSSLLP